MYKKGTKEYNEWIETDKYKLFIKRRSIASSGKNNPMYNKNHTEESKEKIRNSLLGKFDGEKNHFYNKQHTEETRQKISTSNLGRIPPNKGKTGKDSPNFGYRKENPISPLHDLIRHCYNYREWRSDIFTKDNFTCMRCSKRGGYLHAHHKKLFSIILEQNNITTLEQAENCSELWNLNNGITLCKKCHKIEHKK